MRYKFALIWTILPLVLYVVALYTALNFLPSWKFSIEAYDPRDLLMGHYMQYGYKDEQLKKVYADDTVCILKGQEGKDDPSLIIVNHIGIADLPNDCVRIKLKPSGLAKFYIDERYGVKLESALRNQQLSMKVEVVQIPLLDVTMVRELYIGDQTYRDFIRSH